MWSLLRARLAASPPHRCPCRKLTLGYIGGAVHPKSARLPSSVRRSGWREELARPSAMTGACGPRCSIFDTISAGDEDAARQTQRHDQGNPAGSIRSTSPYIHPAKVTVVRSVDLVCPSLEADGEMHHNRCNRGRERYIAEPVATRMPRSVAGQAIRRSDARLQPATEAYVEVGTRNRSIDAMPSA
jgi:hypothetical protein